MILLSGVLLTAVELVIIGVFLGSFYALLSLGLSLIYGVQQIINVAHGEFLMIGAFIVYFSYEILGINPIIGIILMLPIMFAIGGVIQLTLIERIQGREEITSLILTFGLMYTIQNVGLSTLSGNYRTISFLEESISFAGASFSSARPLTFLVASIATGALFGFLKYSDWGKAIRATSQNPEVSKACGIDTRKVRVVTFGIGAAAAGIAGAIAGILFTIHPTMGLEYILKAFVIVVLGGLGSLIGAVIGGLVFGIVEVFGTHYLSANMASLITFAFLILLLIFYPSGFFGREE